jgi:hypothetical protein
MNKNLLWAIGCLTTVNMWLLTVVLLIMPSRDFTLLDLVASGCAGFLTLAAMGFFVLYLGEKKQKEE